MAKLKTWLPTIMAGLAVVAMCVFVFVMSAKPAGESGALSMGVVRFILRHFVPGFSAMDPTAQQLFQDRLHHLVRKGAHFSEFALLGILFANFCRSLLTRIDGCQGSHSPYKTVAIPWGLATAYAATDEIHQLFVPGRSCQFTDVCIDSAGVLVGVLVFALLLRAAKK